MKFYKRDPDRALAGMAELSFEQRGAYNSLLDLLYSRDGDVPDDDERVSRMLSCSKREWARLKKSLISLGKVWSKDGKLGARRVQETINEATEFSNKQRANVSRRWEKSENANENNADVVPSGNTTPPPSGNTSTPTPTPTATPRTPPKGGVVPTPPPFLWEADLFAIEGVKGSGLEIAPYPAMVQLQLDGFDLHAEVIPAVKRDILRAQQQGRLNRLSWHTIAQRVREGRSQANAVRSTPAAINGHTDTGYVAPWDDRMFAARQRKQLSLIHI
jgi:uncharacterized protein YdaU (DUF1376 family)